MKSIDKRGLDFIEEWETYVGYVYDDKVPARKGKYPEYKGGPVRGTLTIGIGHTKAAKAQVDMSLGAKLSYKDAKRVLDIDLDPCEEAVNRLVKVELTQGQFNALVSFVYNCGEGNFRKSSILRKLNRGDYRGARAAFDLYTRSGGEVMRGLVRRRDAEQALWDTPDPSSIAKLVDANPSVDPECPSENTGIDDVDTPKPRPIIKSTESLTSGAQTIGGATGTGNETINAWDAADKAIAAKDKAEQLGVEPFQLWDKVEGTVSILVHSPVFWFSLAVMVAGVYLFLRRRWRMKEEM